MTYDGFVGWWLALVISLLHDFSIEEIFFDASASAANYMEHNGRAHDDGEECQLVLSPEWYYCSLRLR